MRDIIEAAWDNRSLLEQEETQTAIRAVIEQLDLGQLRVAEPTPNGWHVNEWVKKAVVLYFPIQKMETLHAGPLEFHDKMPLKKTMLPKAFAWCPTLLPARCLHFIGGDSHAEFCQHRRLCR